MAVVQVLSHDVNGGGGDGGGRGGEGGGFGNARRSPAAYESGPIVVSVRGKPDAVQSVTSVAKLQIEMVSPSVSVVNTDPGPPSLHTPSLAWAHESSPITEPCNVYVRGPQ